MIDQGRTQQNDRAFDFPFCFEVMGRQRQLDPGSRQRWCCSWRCAAGCLTAPDAIQEREAATRVTDKALLGLKFMLTCLEDLETAMSS